MIVLLKVLSFVLLGTGAFFVYGARYVSKKWMKDAKEDNPSGIQYESEMKKKEQEDRDNQKITNSKMIGMVFVIAGVILVIVTY